MNLTCVERWNTPKTFNALSANATLVLWKIGHVQCRIYLKSVIIPINIVCVIHVINNVSAHTSSQHTNILITSSVHNIHSLKHLNLIGTYIKSNLTVGAAFFVWYIYNYNVWQKFSYCLTFACHILYVIVILFHQIIFSNSKRFDFLSEMWKSLI